MENSNQNSGAKIIKLEVPFMIKPYSKTQLVKLYRPITLYVLNKWLKEIEPQTGAIIGRMLSVRQMEVFVDRYGIPGQGLQKAA